MLSVGGTIASGFLLYTASRMLFTQAREGNFPKQLAQTNPRRKVPTAAIAISASCMFIGAVLAYFYPSSAYVFVASLSTFGFLFAWLMIAATIQIGAKL